MLSSLVASVVGHLFLEGLSELGEGCLQFLACFWWFPVTLDVEFGVVIAIVYAHSFLGPEVFEADVLGESVHGKVQLGLGEWLL